jgi:hypothetical protein
MDIKFLKRQKWDKLDLPTMYKTIEILKMLKATLSMTDFWTDSKGSYSPTRVDARKDELDRLIEYLTKVVETISNSQKK